MSKKQTFIAGVLIILISQFIIKILGFIYRVVITNINGFGDEGNSLYSTGFKVYLVLLAVSTTGIPAALAKLVSEKAAVGDYKGAHRMFRVAFFLFSAIGILGSVVLFAASKPISVWVGNPDAEIVMYVLAPSVFFVAIASVFRGYFQGLYDMRAQADSQVIDQLAKCTFTIGFVYLFMILGQQAGIMFAGTSLASTKNMAAGATLGTTLGTVASAIYLWLYYSRKKRGLWEEIRNQSVVKALDPVRDIMKRLVKLSIPISLGSIILTIAGIVDLATVMNRLQASGVSYEQAKDLFGILTGKGDVLVNFPLALNVAFATALVPAVAGAMAVKDINTASNRIAFSLKITILIGLPASIGLSVLADPIIHTLFPNANAGGYLVAISALSIIFIALSQTLAGALQGLGMVIIPAVALLAGAAVKLALNYTLIPNPAFGIKGAAISSIVCYLIAAAISMIALLRKIKLNINFTGFIIKPGIAVAAMGITAIFIYRAISTYIHSVSVSTLLSIFVAAFVYVLMLLSLKALTRDEFKMLPYGDKISNVLIKMNLL